MGDIQEDTLRYWLKACPKSGGEFPSRQDINIADLRYRMAYVGVIDVEYEPLDFRYRLIGTRIRDFLFEDYTGRSFRELDGKGPDSVLWRIFNKVISDRAPLYAEVPYVGPKADFKQASTLYLPLATDHRNIDKIMLVANFKRLEQIDIADDPDPSRAYVFAIDTPEMVT